MGMSMSWESGEFNSHHVALAFQYINFIYFVQRKPQFLTCEILNNEAVWQVDRSFPVLFLLFWLGWVRLDPLQTFIYPLNNSFVVTWRSLEQVMKVKKSCAKIIAMLMVRMFKDVMDPNLLRYLPNLFFNSEQAGSKLLTWDAASLTTTSNKHTHGCRYQVDWMMFVSRYL